MKDRLDELIVKYWAQSLNATEQQELEQLLLRHPEEWIKMGLMHQTGFQLKAQLSDAESEAIADKILQKKSKRTAKAKRRRNRLRLQGYAFLLAVIGVGLFFLWRQKSINRRAETDWQQITTTNGMKTNLRLADGTEIWLNAGSSLKYPKSFNKKREVWLSGEAYFKVRHQPEKPFIIHTARMDAKVLGTELNVRAYPDEEFSSTALITGKVKVILKKEKQSESFYLKPHQKIVYNDHPAQIQHLNTIKPISNQKINRHLKKVSSNVVLKPVKEIDRHTIPEIAWRKNILIYENETFASLSKRLSRWYGVQFVLKDSSLAGQRFTGRADNVSLKKLLHILQLLKPFTYTLKNDTVIIQ